MPCWLAARLPLYATLMLAALGACKRPEERQQPAWRLPSARAELALPSVSAVPPSSPAVIFEKALQSSKLTLPANGVHAPQLAFGAGVLGQLTPDALRVYDTSDFRLLATEPLESPRAVLPLADGSLLAIGGVSMLRWQRDKKRPTALLRPVLMPRAQFYADAQEPDLLWVMDDGWHVGGAESRAVLLSYRLQSGNEPVLLPEQSIELEGPRGGVFGATREGVWLYLTPGHGQRLSPGGLRLPGLELGDAALPIWTLPTLRVDQGLWIDEAGRLSRVLVSPTYQRLSGGQLVGKPVAADAGDDGRLLAVTVVTGAGPRFELELRDPALALVARVVLPADEPSGTDDWVKQVTENQMVTVAAHRPQVAVGGPGRLTIFDGRGNVLFSIPSR